VELDKIWEDRNKKYENEEEKLEKFDSPMHIFFNIAEVDLSSDVIAETTTSKDEEFTILEDKVIELTNEMEEVGRVRDRYKENLNSYEVKYKEVADSLQASKKMVTSLEDKLHSSETLRLQLESKLRDLEGRLHYETSTSVEFKPGGSSVGNIITPVATTFTQGPWRLDSKTPRFSSKHDEDIDRWILIFENACSLARVNPDFYIKFALGYTENRANDLAITAIASNHTWENIRKP
jgi:hypothetical protein